MIVRREGPARLATLWSAGRALGGLYPRFELQPKANRLASFELVS